MREIVAAHPNLRGLNVTHPYKKDVMPLLDSISPLAQRIGAVNTIVVSRDEAGKVTLRGYNTDSPGFCESLDVFAAAHPLDSVTGRDNPDGDALVACPRVGYRRSQSRRMHGIETARNRADNGVAHGRRGPYNLR